MSELEVLESPRQQASDEIINWDFDWTTRLAGQTISSATAIVTQLDSGADMTVTCVLGSATVVGGNHVQVLVQDLVPRKPFRLTVRSTLSGGTVQDADLLLEVPH